MPFIDSLCWLCQRPLAIAHHGICSICLSLLPTLPHCCHRCGLPAEPLLSFCDECQRKPPAWSQLIAVSDYSYPIKYFITRLKFYREDKYVPLLSRLLLLRWLDAHRNQQIERPQLLLTVPLHHTRHWKRGFNQTALIAHRLVRWINIPYREDILIRHRATPPQQSLKAELRQHNLTNAFSCAGDIRGLHIALLDDIVTTGNTVAEITHLLLHHGAASVQIWCLCRTLKSEGK
ncbi:phosphoribosyltransferase family protein [Limnobaculum parvum]|uniref:DNA utilization protein GntX n=1 Tax=Limnobaculum parvum TaxID=2172103 RepID=A0A2Y9TY13_9GAMM|nr:phosphoribosyltransferase family protein [Limnobaculum parvum]AWH88586.1 DNA utilization protein GntX [Limnobaculum parvum]